MTLKELLDIETYKNNLKLLNQHGLKINNMKVIVILEAIHPNYDNWIPIKIFKYSHENLMIKVPEYIKSLRCELKNNIGSKHLDYEYVALNMEVTE